MVADLGPDRKIYVYPIAGGEPRLIPGVAPSEVPTGWSPDGHELFVILRGDIPAHVYRVDIATGKRTLWKTLEPADSAGIDTIGRVNLSLDTKSYVYSYVRTLSDLYLVQGLK
jgi:Tol biopolymer transport system component